MMTMSNISPSTQQRVMQRLIPGIVLAFVLIGLLGMFSIRANAANNLGGSQALLMNGTIREIENRLDSLINDVSALSTLSQVKSFARNRGGFGSGNAFIQDGIWTVFLEWVHEHPLDLVAVRYVAANQSNYAEVRQTMRGPEISQEQTMYPIALLETGLAGLEGAVFVLSPQAIKSFIQDSVESNFILMAPVIDNDGTTLGLIQVELKAEVLLNPLFAIAGSGAASARQLILLNNNIQRLVDTAVEEQNSLFTFIPSAAQASFESGSLVSLLQNNPEDIHGVSSENWMVSTGSLVLPRTTDAPWRLALLDDTSLALQESNSLSIFVLALSVVVGLGLAFAVRYALRSLLRPFEQVTSLMGEWGGEIDVTPGALPDDALSQTIAQMAGRARAISTEMEVKRSRLRQDLEIAARISSETMQHSDLDTLLKRVISLICAEQRFYHAQVFLLDEIGENLILAYSNGDFGTQLMAKSPRVSIDTPSSLSRVVLEGRVEMLNNLNALSADASDQVASRTKSRLLLPMRAGDSILGVLDIQSSEVDTFLDEERQALVLLSNQVSTSIYNIRLLQESNERVQEINALNRELTRSAWDGVEERLQFERSYHYDLQEVRTGVSQEANDDLLNMPITIRGEVVGSLEVALSEDGELTSDEQLILQAVTDRVALAIDRARLFQETQLSLSETSLLYELSRRINEATELEEIIAALVASVMPDAIGGLIMEFDEYPSGTMPVWLRIRTDWAADGRDWRQSDLVDRKLHVPDYAFLSSLNSQEVRLIGDLDSTPMDESLRQLFQRLGAGALAVIPLVMRSMWRGLIVIEFPGARRFSQQDLRVYTALIDQAGVAIDNSLLLRQTEATLNEISRLYAASSAISSAPDLSTVYQAAAEHLVQASAASVRIMFLLAEPDRSFDAPYLEYSFVWDGGVNTTMLGQQVPRDDVPYVQLVEPTGASPARAREILDSRPDVMAQLEAEGIYSVIVTPLQSRQQWFGMLICASPQIKAFDDQFRQFVQTVGDQVAIAVENRDLIRVSETERETLGSIVGAMPSGVLVLDAETMLPVHINDQIEQLLGRPVDPDQPFRAQDYNLYRTGTQLYYADDELPTSLSKESGELAFADDIVAIHPDGTRVDFLLNAAPIRNPDGEIVMIVASFENISSLRGLENALQDNLRETIALYEATRALTEADQVTDVLNVMMTQLDAIEPHDAAVILYDESNGNRLVARTLSGDLSRFDLPDAIFDNRAALMVDDVAYGKKLSEEVKEELIARGILAFSSMPLRTRARSLPIGWMMTSFSRPHEFGSEEERYITTLVDSAATALDNRYLFQSTENALQEASILYQASRAITTASESKDILNAVLDYLVHDDVNHVFLVLLNDVSWDAPGASGDVIANWNGDDTSVSLEGVSLTPDHFPAWRLLASDELLMIGDIYQSAELSEFEQIGVESLGSQSLVLMPLRVANRSIGAIWMGSPNTHTYTERDQRIYQSFAEQTAISINAAQLFDQAERRAGQLQTSSKVSQAVSSILELDLLLPRLVDLIKEAFNYDHVQVFLLDREERYAILRASTGEAGRQLLAINHKLEKGSLSVIGAVTAENRPIVASDTGLGDAIHKPNPYLPHTRSEMALPLIIKGQVVGALDVQSNRPNAFKDEDVAVLTTLAAQISVAIDNARLFEQSEHRASDMSLLFQVTTAAAAADSLTDALQNVANDLLNSLKALSVGIYLPVHYLDEIAGDMRTTMRVSAIAGYDQPLREIEEVEIGDLRNIIGVVSQHLQAQIINNIAEQPNYLPLSPQAQAAVVVPLAASGQIVGLVVMENEQVSAYNQETLTLLQTMGGTLTALIQNQQLLERLQETNERLLEIDRVKSEFLANMSHELRTPLNSIIGFSRVILKGIDGPLTEMQEQDLTTIYNSGQHLLNLINDILDHAKIVADKMEIRPDYFDIKAVVDGVRSIGIGLVKDKRIDIKVDMESGLPQVYGDEIRTRQILLNLLSNAAKFTNDGSIILSVYRDAHRKTGAEMVRVDVTDTGIGIAEKDLPLLFEAFRQVDSSLTRTAGGTGLGLPISKSLVELQGGEMMVESEVNRGSTFSVTIPVQPPPESLEADTEEGGETLALNGQNGHGGTDDNDKRRTVAMPAIAPAKRQLLVIEDNPDRVDQFRRVIQREGFDVFAASIPLEAEAMASGLHPSVIIMDVNFSNGAGWDILHKIKDRDDTFDIPIVVVSLTADRDQVVEAGAFAFLQHPIVPEDLVEVVLAAEKESNRDRILIIDDQPESTRLLMQMLDERGQYRVFSAPSGPEGVALVARRRPDLVILDLRMPEMDGFAVLDELRSNPETSGIPILVVTSDTLDASEEDQLDGIHVMYKTDLSLDNSHDFIDDVQKRLSRNGD